MTLTENDAKRARALLSETANKTLPIDAFIEASWSKLKEAIPAGKWFNNEKEIISTHINSITSYSGSVAEALLQSMKTGNLNKLKDTLPRLIESVNDTNEYYFSNTGIEQSRGVVNGGILGIRVKAESDYQEGSIEEAHLLITK